MQTKSKVRIHHTHCHTVALVFSRQLGRTGLPYIHTVSTGSSLLLLQYGLYVEIISLCLSSWSPLASAIRIHLSFLYLLPVHSFLFFSPTSGLLPWTPLSPHSPGHYSIFSPSSFPPLTDFPFILPPTLSFSYISSLPCFLFSPSHTSMHSQGTMMGWLTAAGSLARTVGPLFVSTVYDNFGAQVLFAVCIGIVAVAILTLLVFYRKLVPNTRHAHRLPVT